MSALARELTAASSIEAPLGAQDHFQKSNVRRLRLLARRKVTIPAFLRHGDRVSAIDIRNISVGGAGFAMPLSVGVGETVSLHLLDGRNITGTLQWSRMGFAGIAFETLLQTDDPILGTVDSPAQVPSPPAKVPQVVAKIMSFAAAVSGSLHDRRKRTRDHEMLEAACRKQGYAWLVDEDTGGQPPQE